VMLLIVAVGQILHLSGGWPQRPPFANGSYAQSDVQTDQDKRLERNQGRCEDPKWRRLGCPDEDMRVGLVVGNSHAIDGDIIMAAATGGTDRLILSGLGGCPPIKPSETKRFLNRNMRNNTICEQMNAERWTPEYYEGIDYVVVSTTYRRSGFSPDRLDEYIDFLREVGIEKIIVLGQFIRLRDDLLVALPKCDSIQELVARYSRDNFAFNDDLSKICMDKDCLFIDKERIMCDESGCILESDGVPFTWDRGHLTWQFATLVGHRTRSQVLGYLNEP